jgi:hypothetical protein
MTRLVCQGIEEEQDGIENTRHARRPIGYHKQFDEGSLRQNLTNFDTIYHGGDYELAP